MNQVDILAIGAHPDDIELGSGGTLIRMIEQGKSVGLLDLTMGELGSNGSGPLRLEEAEEARKRMGADWRHNLRLRDGFFEVDEVSICAVARIIRIARPQIILANAPTDRHPDHGKGAELVDRACFISGLIRVELNDDAGRPLERWRPKIVLNYIQDMHIPPHIVVDITEYHQKKLDMVSAYSSQFYMNKEQVHTPISDRDFWIFLEARAREMGRIAGTSLGEGFVSRTVPCIGNLMDLIR
ncbi:MAG: bacillithiol biosynthesis deacetylase BshB1 [Saprospiraceae bacterium]|nr:bacillithiol biosynthesis deacetylase BshB1 [Saprospiraceae bacterium]